MFRLGAFVDLATIMNLWRSENSFKPDRCGHLTIVLLPAIGLIIWGLLARAACPNRQLHLSRANKAKLLI